MTFFLERSTNLGGTTAVRPRAVESSFDANAAPLPLLVGESALISARLIKIDVEGGEAATVRGLIPLLPRLRDDAELIIEVTPGLLAKQGCTVGDVLGPLLGHDSMRTGSPTTTPPQATRPLYAEPKPWQPPLCPEQFESAGQAQSVGVGGGAWPPGQGLGVGGAQEREPVRRLPGSVAGPCRSTVGVAGQSSTRRSPVSCRPAVSCSMSDGTLGSFGG